MLRSMKMLRGMLIFGTVAAADMAAGQAEAEMNPGIPDFEAVLAPIGAGFHFLDFSDVGALGHFRFLSNVSFGWSFLRGD